MKSATNHNIWLYKILPPSLLAALTWLIYWPSLHYDFQFDDIANILKHFNIRSNTLASLKFTGTRWISYWLNAFHYSINKFNPFSYRVCNVLIHTINGLLIFFILSRALENLKKESFFKNNAQLIAFLSALFFLLHPVQTQTVSYVIQGELEGLVTLSILSMILCLLHFVSSKSFFSKVFFCATLFGIAALSCGTKEIAIISPILLLIFDWFFIAQGNWQSFKSRFLLYSILTAFIICVYLWLVKATFFTSMFDPKKNNVGNVITADPTALITPYNYFISQFKVLLHYLVIFLWPFNICVEYDWVLARGLLAPDCFFPLLILLAITYGILALLRKNRAHLFAFGLIWFFACMAPRASFIPSPELLVDYKTYLASFGYLFLLACVCTYLILKLINAYKKIPLISDQRYSAIAVGLLIALPLGLATIQRNAVWSSGLNFWGNVVKNAPGKARAYNNYGVELSQKEQKFHEAIVYFKKAIEMDKKYADPCNNLAVAYSQIGKVDEAIAALRQGLSINPTYPEGYNNLASFLLMKKEYDQAEQCLNTALALRPYYGKAFFNMGRVHLERGNPEKAYHYFRDSCYKGDLDNDIGFSTFGKICIELKRFDDAIEAFKKVIAINPQFPEAKLHLANAYFLSERLDAAIALYDAVIRETPQETRAYFNKGETYLKMNEPEKALRCFQTIVNTNHGIVQLPIRMAVCFEKMGKPNQARQCLVEAQKNPMVPEQIKQIAQNLINVLDQRYPVNFA